MNQKVEKSVLPIKAIWTVFFFSIFGLITLIVSQLYFKTEETTLSFLDRLNSSSATGDVPIFSSNIPYAKNANAKDSKEENLKLKINDLAMNYDNIEKPDQLIEDPSGIAMASFNEALRQSILKKRAKPVRILHYGDSILTTDQLSGQTRKILQNSFGDAGHGFVLLGKPWRWYHHLGVEHGAKGKWKIRPFTSAPISDGLYGLGGVAFQAVRGSHGRAWAGTVLEDTAVEDAELEGNNGRTVKSFDVSYLAQPGGGSFKILINGKEVETIFTKSENKKTVHKEIIVPFGAARLDVEYNNDGKVRLFGVVLENGKSGVVYDSLAINGSRAAALARFNEEHWISELNHRDPSLVIMMMGANEGANKFLVLGEYRKHLANILQKIKKGVPKSSCLVMGPLDQAKRNVDKTFTSKKMPEKLSKTQREVAIENGCAYFDTWQAMGGRGSMGKWFRRGLGGGDYIHPTKHGARKIGKWLAEALLYAFKMYNPTVKEGSHEL